jgi:hypothetical protein
MILLSLVPKRRATLALDLECHVGSESHERDVEIGSNRHSSGRFEMEGWIPTEATRSIVVVVVVINQGLGFKHHLQLHLQLQL